MRGSLTTGRLSTKESYFLWQTSPMIATRWQAKRRWRRLMRKKG